MMNNINIILKELKKNKIKIKNNKLDDIYKLIKREYNNVQINIDNIEYEKTLNVLKNSGFEKSRFFPEEITKYVKKTLINCFIINYNNTEIYFFTEFIPKKINDEIIKIMNNICKIIFILRKIYNNQHHLRINYFDCLLKKRFPTQKGEILKEINCNSGLSYVGNYYMMVYRREEYKRVMIHELIHSFMGDYSLIDVEYNQKLSEYFCLKNDENININETYTETLATIINLIFISLETDENFNKMFEIELSYSILVMTSILRHYNYKDINELKRDNENCKLLLQQTSVFNYYIMKPFMLININEFFDLIKRCSNDYKFSELNICLDDIYKLIINNFNNNKLKWMINNLLKDKTIKTNNLSMVFYNK